LDEAEADELKLTEAKAEELEPKLVGPKLKLMSEPKLMLKP
jgi:hypothetical protein